MCDTGHAIARALECEVWVARFEGELSMDASCMRGGTCSVVRGRAQVESLCGDRARMYSSRVRRTARAGSEVRWS